jgi:hypothetical protein
MFFSKIWLFLLTLVAVAAITVALLLPRPAERAHVLGEQQRLAVGCGVVNVLLADNARRRVDFTRRFARHPELASALYSASGAEQIDERRAASVREIGNRLIGLAKGDAPDFAMMIDTRGRVVARAKRDEKEFGDLASGRPLVDDALSGLVRDDVWILDNTLYLVAASPVMGRDPIEYTGAVVLGHRVTTELARSFTQWSRGDEKNKQFHVDLGVYLGADLVASTTPVAMDTAPMVKAVSGLSDKDVSRDCALNQPINLKAGKDEYTAVVARMPGEAQARQAYFTVYIQRPSELGLVGSTMAIRKSDLSPATFPWALVSGGFVVALLIGLGLMVLESDRPLRRLVADAAKLAKGDIERLSEAEHPGRYGSVARNVNIQIDRVARAAKTAKQDLDQLLGPAPQGSLGTIDLLAGMGSPSAPAPAPSEFRFSDAQQRPAASARDQGIPLDLSGGPPAPAPTSRAPGLPGAPPARPKPPLVTPPSMPAQVPSRAPTPPPMPAVPAPPAMSPVLRLDDDILGAPTSPPGAFSAGPVPGPASGAVPAPVAGPMSGPVSAPVSFAPATPSAAMRSAAAGMDTGSEAYFRDVYAQFMTAKQSCGESTAGVTFEKFADKLRRNRDELISRTGCREVSFTVYIKDGKAALKASPVRG